MAYSMILHADIFSSICQLLPKESLAVVARTAKVLQDPAIRELWRSITKASHLLFPFGSSVDRAGNKLYFSSVPTSAYWDRFRFYAQYVRTLRIGNDIELSSLSILLHHQPLFPDLRSMIVCKSWPSQDLSSLSILFTASIEKLEIHYQEDLATLEALITTTAPGLQDLTVLLPAGRWEFGSSIPTCRNLSAIDIPLTSLQVHTVLSHLSTLHSLSRIRFHLMEWAGIPGIPGSGSKYSFPATKDLFINTKFDGHPMHLLAITSFDNLTNLQICRDIIRRDDDSLSKAIAASCGQSLNQIYISQSTGITREIGHQILLFFTFYPLLQFTNIRSFIFRIEHTFFPADEDILSIVKSWPNLEEFCVDTTYIPGLKKCPLTLTGFLLLIEQCTKLVKVSIAVDARHIPNIAGPISRPNLTIKLHSWYSLIRCPKSLADFLSLVLPDADIGISDADVMIDGEEHRELKEAVSLHYKERYIKQVKELQRALNESRREIARLRALLSVQN